MRMIDNDEVGLKNSQNIHNCFIWNRRPSLAKSERAEKVVVKHFYLELHIQECAGSLLPEGTW